MDEKLKHLCMEGHEAIEFLENALRAKEIVNELTGLAQTRSISEMLSRAYHALDEVLSPRCPDCLTIARRFVTSPAQLFDPDMASFPGGSTTSWTGEWFCNNCRRVIAYGENWWIQTSPKVVP